MKTIKIFLASSEELKPERVEMTELIYQLNRLFKVRGIEFVLERWEYLDASMGIQRKQDEYNEVLKQCDICIVLFWRRFGNFTGEELDTAYQQMRNGEKPQKIYVFFKNPGDESISDELRDFIQNYGQRFGGHFYGMFQNADSLKLEFLLQLELYQKDVLGEETIQVHQEQVCIGNEAIADLNQLPFVANNKGFHHKQEELKKLCEEIAALQAEVEKKQQKLERKKRKLEESPDDEDCQEDYADAKEAVESLTSQLQKELDHKNKLEKECESELQNLMDTKRRIVEAKEKTISVRMTRAIEAFENGDAQRADVILDEAEKDADEALEDVRMAKKFGIQSLKELELKASVKMANNSIPIDMRVAEFRNLYEKAISLAREYDHDECRQLIIQLAEYLVKHGKHQEAIEYYRMSLKYVNKDDTLRVAERATLIKIARIYDYLHEYPLALEYYMQTLYIDEENWTQVLTKDFPGKNIKERPEIIELYENALPWAEKAVTAEPDNSYCVDVLAKIKQRL